jgi:hypothetical protein
MRRLARRIGRAGTNHSRAQAGLRPVYTTGPSAQALGAESASPPVGTTATPMVMPMSMVTYHPDPAYPWGTAAYQDLHPLWAADSGGQIAAKDAGSWGNLYAAGNTSPAHG